MPACMQHRNVRTALFLSDPKQRKVADGTSGHEALHNTLTKNVLCPCSPDDDLCPHGSHTDLDAGVAVLSQLSGKELVKLGIEHAICDELHAGTKDLLSYSTMLCSGYGNQCFVSCPPQRKDCVGGTLIRPAYLPLLADVGSHAGQVISWSAASWSMHSLWTV